MCELLSPRCPVEAVAALLERVILQGVEALRIIDYRHDALGQRACVVEHEKVGAGLQRHSLDRTIERRDRNAVEHVVEDLQLESTAERLGDDADASLGEQLLEILYPTEEGRRVGRTRDPRREVGRRGARDRERHAGRGEDRIRDADERREVRLLHVPVEARDDGRLTRRLRVDRARRACIAPIAGSQDDDRRPGRVRGEPRRVRLRDRDHQRGPAHEPRLEAPGLLGIEPQCGTPIHSIVALRCNRAPHAALVVVRDVDDGRSAGRNEVGHPSGLEVIDHDCVPMATREQRAHAVAQGCRRKRHARQPRRDAREPAAPGRGDRVPRDRGRGRTSVRVVREPDADDLDPRAGEGLGERGRIHELAVGRRMRDVTRHPEAAHLRHPRQLVGAGVIRRGRRRPPLRRTNIRATSCIES